MRGLPSPFIKIYERGRETPRPSLWPYYRVDLFAGTRRLNARSGFRGAGQAAATHAFAAHLIDRTRHRGSLHASARIGVR